MGNEQSEKQLECGIIGFPIQKFIGINANKSFAAAHDQISSQQIQRRPAPGPDKQSRPTAHLRAQLHLSRLMKRYPFGKS